MTDALTISWIGGNCPVQAEGTIDGKPFYFRARFDSWSMRIGGDPVGNPEWRYDEDYGDEPFAAGWMTEEEALAFIERAAEMYLAEKEWTEETWNPIVSPYVLASEDVLSEPLHCKQPTRWVVVDLFYESIPDEWIDRVFTVMALCPQHTFHVLTKRAARMREYATRLDEESVADTLRRIVAAWPGRAPIPDEGITIPLPNVWLGVSCERQHEANERIPHLLATPAAVRFVACEPLLGPIDLTRIECIIGGNSGTRNALTGTAFVPGCGSISSKTWRNGPRLDWVIVGGHDVRPMGLNWAQSLRDQCARAGVHFVLKPAGMK